MAEELHTAEKLARALEDLADPALAGMIDKARQGYYHDFLSPLSFPEIQLVADLRAADHPTFAQRVIAGEFDASKAEADAWAVSPEGQETFTELVGDVPPGGNRAQRRGNRNRRTRN